MPELSIAAAFVAALASSSSAAILRPLYGVTPREVLLNPSAYRQVNQTKPPNTSLDVLADDEPRVWIGSGGATSTYWVARTTPRISLWTIDGGSPLVVTIDSFDLTPFANAPSLDLVVTYAIRSVSTITRTYRANVDYVAFSHPRGAPEPSSIALEAIAVGLAGTRGRLH